MQTDRRLRYRRKHWQRFCAACPIQALSCDNCHQLASSHWQHCLAARQALRRLRLFRAGTSQCAQNEAALLASRFLICRVPVPAAGAQSERLIHFVTHHSWSPCTESALPISTRWAPRTKLRCSASAQALDEYSRCDAIIPVTSLSLSLPPSEPCLNSTTSVYPLPAVHIRLTHSIANACRPLCNSAYLRLFANMSQSLTGVLCLQLNLGQSAQNCANKVITNGTIFNPIEEAESVQRLLWAVITPHPHSSSIAIAQKEGADVMGEIAGGWEHASGLWVGSQEQERFLQERCDGIDRALISECLGAHLHAQLTRDSRAFAGCECLFWLEHMPRSDETRWHQRWGSPESLRHVVGLGAETLLRDVRNGLAVMLLRILESRVRGCIRFGRLHLLTRPSVSQRGRLPGQLTLCPALPMLIQSQRNSSRRSRTSRLTLWLG